MAKATKFTAINLTDTTKIAKTTATNGSAAAGSAPTKAEFDAVVTLVNDLKAKYNDLVDALTT